MGRFDELIGGPIRRLVWSLPGGRQAFPQGSGDTIRWGRGASLRDHAQGRTVLGAAATGGVGGMFGSDDRGGGFSTWQPATRVIPAPWMTGQQQGGWQQAARQGSVVAQGFVGRGGAANSFSSRGGDFVGPPAPNRPSRSETLGISQMPVIGRTDIGDELDPSFSRPNDARDYISGGQGRGGPTLGNSGYRPRGGHGGTVSSQHNLGAGALGSGGDAAMQDGFTALHNRRGLLAEF